MLGVIHDCYVFLLILSVRLGLSAENICHLAKVLFLIEEEDLMKQPKKLTRDQKSCLFAHNLNWKDWMLVEETEFCYRIIHKTTRVIKSVDKFARRKR